MSFKSQIAVTLGISLILLISIGHALTYNQEFNIITQSIINTPYFSVENNVSDVDLSEDKGTHSNFTAQQYSDAYLDTLTEAETVDSGGTQEFMIHRGTFTTTNFTHTLNEGVDYTLIMDNATRAFFRLTNTRHTGMGETSSGGSQNIETWTWRITNPSNLETNVTLERDGRLGTTYPVRVTWEIWEYIGEAGGENEMIVRQQEVLTGNSSTASLDGTTMSGSSFNKEKSAIFITSQSSNEAARYDPWSMLNTFEFIANGSDWIPRATIGKAAGSITRWVSYAVVDFAGSNWRNVTRFSTTIDGTICGIDPWVDNGYDVSLTPSILNTSRTFLEIQFRTDRDNCGLDESGDAISIVDGDTDSLRLRQFSTAANKYNVAWVIESISDTIKVEHLTLYMDNGGSEERTEYFTLTNTINFLNNTGIAGMSVISHGSGQAYPRASVDYYLYNTTSVQHKTSDTGQEYFMTLDVIQFPLSEESTNCELDLEVQWVDVDFSEANEELCIYGGTMGSESIRVDAWNGSGWDNLLSDLNPQWNNVTVTSYLTSSTFTIRFKGAIETKDPNQDSWAIDATLLHVWS